MQCPECGTVDTAPPVFASYVLQVFMNCYFIFNKSSQKKKWFERILAKNYGFNLVLKRHKFKKVRALAHPLFFI